MKFITEYLSADFQLSRFKRHMDDIENYGNYIDPPDSGGYASIKDYLSNQILDYENLTMLIRRVWYILSRPSVFLAILKGRWLTQKASKKYSGIDVHFNYWIYVWTNMGMKYNGLKPEHISLESVDENYDFTQYQLSEKNTMSKAQKLSGDEKTVQQARFTDQALEKIRKQHGTI